MKYTESEVLEFISTNDVKFIKLLFTDIFGNIKSISIMPDELPRAFQTGISFDGSSVKGFMQTSESDLFLVPDPATLAILPWRPQHGRVIRFYCNIKKPDGTLFDGDGRYILQKTVAEAEKLGYTCKIGTECEFYLFENDESGIPTHIPHDRGTYCDQAPRDKGENVRREICLTLEEMGIKPETSHHETGPGQHEIDFKYSDPCMAAENLSTFKTVVKTIAARNGLFASFMPKPLENKSGSGLHINISLHKDGRNLFQPLNSDKLISSTSEAEHLVPEARYFIAGILKYVAEITAILNPLENSYKRFGDFEAPKHISWSVQNRSQLIRVPAAHGEYVRIELRSPDPACNPYLALSLILKAGMKGIEEKLELPKPHDIDLFTASKNEIKGIPTLPDTLKDALALLEKSTLVKSVFPEKTLSSYISSKESGIEPDFEEV